MSLKKGTLLTLSITDLAFGGKGIAKINTPEGELIAFIPNTIPGQTVQARIFKKRKKFIECKLINIITRSPDEQNLPYQPISGAPFIYYPIEKQQQYKLKNTLELYKRLGKIPHIESLFDTYINSPSIFHYRNKMEYAFSQIQYDLKSQEIIDDAFVLGSKRKGTWWMVENLEKDSGIFDKKFENKLHLLTSYLQKTNLPAWHPPKKEGFFRYLTVRKSHYNNKLIINLTTSLTHIKSFNTQQFVAKILDLYADRIAGIIHTINDSLGERSGNEDNTYTTLYGENKIEERLLNLTFDVSMQSFFQTNPKSAELLYQKVIDYVLLNETYRKEDIIMDLFCGTGTIGQLIAKQTKTNVIGVDIVSEAIENAKINALKNKVTTATFFTADVGKFLKEQPHYQDKIKTIVLDPPRGGIAPKSLLKIMELKANRIIYVSCNPATQARDLQVFFEYGYALTKLSLVDQFPHTAHIESIALLNKQS